MKENMDFSKVMDKLPPKGNTRKILTKTSTQPISTADCSPVMRQNNQGSRMKDNFNYTQTLEKKNKHTTLSVGREKAPIEGSQPKALTRLRPRDQVNNLDVKGIEGAAPKQY